MGLDTSHGCWHGAYSAFSRWRNELARRAGYAVWELKYDSGMVMPTPMLDWGHLPAGYLEGEWPETPKDPLVVLLVHSDCDGVIHPAQAGPLADRLAELIPLLPTTEDPGHIGNWQATTQRFIDGLRLAAKQNEVVEFH